MCGKAVAPEREQRGADRLGDVELLTRLRGQPPDAAELLAAIEALPRKIAAALAASDELIERLGERLRDSGPGTGPSTPALIDPAEAARRLGRTRRWIYEHADELGAIRLGTGPRPRLMFDPEQFAAISGRNRSSPQRRRLELLDRGGRAP